MQKGRIIGSANCGSNTSNLDNNGNNSNAYCDHSDSIPPQYRMIWSLIEAACSVDQGCLFDGHCPLQCRANYQDHFFNLHERSVMDKQSLKEWAQLKQKSMQKSMNSSAS